VFGRAIHSLSKIGEELYIEALDDGVRYSWCSSLIRGRSLNKLQNSVILLSFPNIKKNLKHTFCREFNSEYLLWVLWWRHCAIIYKHYIIIWQRCRWSRLVTNSVHQACRSLLTDGTNVWMFLCCLSLVSCDRKLVEKIIHSVLCTDDITIITSSSKNFCVCLKLIPYKTYFQIFPILRINGMAPFCNLFIEWHELYWCWLYEY